LSESRIFAKGSGVANHLVRFFAAFDVDTSILIHEGAHGSGMTI